MSELTDQILKLRGQSKTLTTRRATLVGQIDASKDRLRQIIDEIKAKGYEPTTLGDTIKLEESQLSVQLATIESELQNANRELTRIEEAISANRR